MYLNGAVFENYRNIGSFSFSFDPGINILYGKNAQGKTNVIEGIYLFGSGKSFRHARERDLIRYNCDHAQVAITYTDSVRENKMNYRVFRDTPKEISKNGIKVGRMSGFIGNFKAVLFCPEHLSIVKNEPAERRSFLDGAISQFHRPYLSALMEYKKLLEQRNALLKNYEKNKDGFALTAEVISEKLAADAAFITEIRAKYLQRLFSLVNGYLHEMTGGKETVGFQYLSAIADEDIEALFDREENFKKYKRLFTKDIQKEIIIGTTLSGSHKDDFEIRLNGMNAKYFASQGQQRSIALAMKLAEGELSRQEGGEYPVFLLDDVLSELDRERKNYILSELHGRQVIITTCDENDFKDVSNATKIYVENGTYAYM
jgi:DNA replication and repair protein RecF